MNLDQRSSVQSCPFQFGKLFLSKPKGAPKGARKHIQVSANAVTHHFSYGSNYLQARAGGSRGNSVTDRGLTASRVSQGVGARPWGRAWRGGGRRRLRPLRARGIAGRRVGPAAPAWAWWRDRAVPPSPPLHSAGASSRWASSTRGKGEERYRRWSPARGRRWRRRPSPCRRMRGSCSCGGRRRWTAAEREGSGIRVLEERKDWTGQGKEREGATWSHWRKDSSLTSSSAAAVAMAVFEFDGLREWAGGSWQAGGPDCSWVFYH